MRAPWALKLLWSIVLCQYTALAQISKLADGVYARIGNPNGNAVANTGFVILDQGILVYDAHFTPEAGQALLADIRKTSTKPIRYLINSHFHPDHTHGNQAVGSASQIISSTATRRNILQMDVPALARSASIAQSQIEKLKKDLGPVTDSEQQEGLKSQIRQRQDFLDRMRHLQIIPPVLTVDDNLTIIEANRELKLLFLGKAHTDGDLVLYLPKERIVFAGDIFFNSALPNSQDAFLLDWPQTLEALLKLDAEVFVPGHGPVGNRERVKEFLSYLQDLRKLVEPAISRGSTIEQLLQEGTIQDKYSAFEFQEFFHSNLEKMYRELKALERAQPGPDPSKKPPAPAP